MFYLMELRVLWNGFFESLIMLRVFGKELPDSINHGFDKYANGIENVQNKFSDNMHNLDRKIVHKKLSNNIKAIGINLNLLNCMGGMGSWVMWVMCVHGLSGLHGFIIFWCRSINFRCGFKMWLGS